jgi:hypothetical protein
MKNRILKGVYHGYSPSPTPLRSSARSSVSSGSGNAPAPGGAYDAVDHLEFQEVRAGDAEYGRRGIDGHEGMLAYLQFAQSKIYVCFF